MSDKLQLVVTLLIGTQNYSKFRELTVTTS